MGDSVEHVGEAIDRIPIGRFHLALVGVMGGMWAAMAIGVLSISFVLPTFIESWELSGLAAGVLGSASLVGMLIGNTVGGWYADRAGRRRTMVLAVTLFSVATALTGLSVGFYSASGFRFLTGLGLGSALVAGASYTTEHLPKARRGRYVTYLEAFFSLGSIATVLLAWAILSVWAVEGQFAGVTAWRVFFGFGIFGLGLAWIIYRYLPPSPYFLATNGRTEAAARRIADIAGANEVANPAESGSLSVAGGEGGGGFRRLFESGLAGTTLLMAGVWFAVNLAYYAVFTWLPTTVVAAGYVGNLYRYLLVVAFFQLFGQLTSAYLIEVIGRKLTLGALLGLSGASITLFATALPGVQLGLGIGEETAFAVGIFAMAFALFGAWAVLYAYTAEVFPTEVRSTGLGLSGSVGKVAAAAGPILFGSLVSVGYLAALVPVAVILVLAGLALLLFGVETKGQTLV
jgi:putative MFS transporter